MTASRRGEGRDLVVSVSRPGTARRPDGAFEAGVKTSRHFDCLAQARAAGLSPRPRR